MEQPVKPVTKRLTKAQMAAYLKWARANKWKHLLAFMRAIS